MASRSNLGGAGGVQMTIDGDATPLENKIAESKAKVEAANATLKLSDKDALDLRKMDAQMEIDKTTEAFLRMQNAGRDAVGPDSPVQGGLKGLNKQLGDTVGQVQGLIGKFAIVAGVATGMFALGRAIREGVISALETGTEKAEKFAGSLDLSKKAESIKSITDEVNKLAADLEDQSNNPLDRAVGFITGTNPEKLKEEINRLNALAASLRKNNEAKRVSDEKIAAEAAQAERLADWERENDARVAAASIAANEKRDKDIQAEIEAHDRRLELLAEYRNKQEEAARKTREAWVSAFEGIRSKSNEVFGSNRAMGNVGVASALESMNTRSGASNRIFFDGGN